VSSPGGVGAAAIATVEASATTIAAAVRRGRVRPDQLMADPAGQSPRLGIH